MAESRFRSRGILDPVWLLALAFGAGAIVVHATASYELGRTGVLHEWDVLFNADPTVYTTSFTTGRNTYLWGGRSFVHPNITNVIYPAVTAAASIVHTVVPDASIEILRRRVAYLVCPLASGATAVALFLLFAELDLGATGASMLVLLYLASFSALVFGSIPESYCLSALAFALLFLLATHAARDAPVPDGLPGDFPSQRPGRPRRWSRAAGWPVWVAVGAIATSITITNIVPFTFVAIAIRRLRASRLRAIAWSAAVAGGALAITLAGYAAGAVLSPHAPPFVPGVTGQVRERHAFDPQVSLIGFPTALANTVIPPAPLKVPGDTGLHQAMRFGLTYHAPFGDLPGEWWRALLTLALLGIALVRVRSMTAWQQAVIAGAVAVVGFNWVLHAFYGSELFLYSQHWAIPLLVIFAALIGAPGRGAHLARALLAGVVVTAIWNSVRVWDQLIRMLGGRS